jgi:NitT/TauT family transport system permease protein
MNSESAAEEPESISRSRSLQAEAPGGGVAPSPKGKPRNLENRYAKVGLGVLGLAVFVILWDAYAVLLANPLIIATPASMVESLIALLQNQIPREVAGVDNIYAAMAATIELIVIGYGFSLTGIPVGFIMGRWRAAEAIIDPWINALYAIPMVAIAPLIYVSMGGNFVGELLIVFLMTFFTITINTFHGVRYVSNTYAEVGSSFGASERQFVRHIILPASLPDIVAGMRLGLGRAVLGSIVAEVVLGYNGLGYMMMSFLSLSRITYMMAVISIIAGFGILFLNAPRLIERRLFKWKESERLSRSM